MTLFNSRNEFIRGCAIVQNKYNKSDLWTELCTGICATFFSAYPYYVQVDISSLSPVDQRHWFGWVESRLRLLILALDNEPMGYFCHPQANCFHRMLDDRYSLTYTLTHSHTYLLTLIVLMKVVTTQSRTVSCRHSLLEWLFIVLITNFLYHL